MGRPLALIVLLIGCMVAVPTVLADSTEDSDQDFCVITITPNDDFSIITVEEDLVLNEDEIKDLSHSIDLDADGTISRRELQQYEDDSLVTIADPEDLGKNKLLRNGWWPTQVTIHRELKGFEGPIELQGNVTVTEIRTFYFPSSVEPTHSVTGGLYAEEESRVVVEVVQLRPPPGWVVWSVNNRIYKESELTLKDLDLDDHYRIVFSLEGFDPSNPDPPPPQPHFLLQFFPFVLIAAVVAAALSVVIVERKVQSRKNEEEEKKEQPDE